MKLARTAMTAAVLAGVCLGAWAQAPKLEGLDIVLDAVPAGPVALVTTSLFLPRNSLNCIRGN